MRHQLKIPLLTVLGVVLSVATALAVNYVTGGDRQSVIGVVGVIVLTILTIGVALWTHRVRSQEILLAAMKAHRDAYSNRPWRGSGLVISVSGDISVEHDARSALYRWALTGSPRVIVLSGDFGSGKTWLLRWLAFALAKRRRFRPLSTPIPILVRAKDLQGYVMRTRNELLAHAQPLPMNTAAVEAGGKRVLLLLDGLDELVGTDPKIADQFWPTIRSIIAVEPQSTCFLLSCRRHVVESTNLVTEVGSLASAYDRFDRTVSSVKRFFAQDAEPIGLLTLNDIDPGEADAFLLAGQSASAWRDVQDQAAYRELARSPFAIYLLQIALNAAKTDSEVPPDLPSLYEKTIEVWLDRQGISGPDVKIANARLELLALLEFHGNSGPRTDFDKKLIDCGLLVNDGSGSTFRHYSLFEYYLSKNLVNELYGYSSELLRSLNLIHLYNINRFAIPALLKESREEVGRGDTADQETSWVSRRDFQKFVEETGWRRSGYGLWPSVTDPLGRSAITAKMTILHAGPNIATDTDEEEKFLAGVSWYDAFQYCRWQGGRLPSADEAAWFPVSGGEETVEWSTTWYAESDSWITAIVHGDQTEPTKRIGVNPDIRLAKLGFRIVRFGVHS